MYKRFSKTRVEHFISFKNKVRRISMEKRNKICALCLLFMTTVFYVMYSVFTMHWGNNASFLLGGANAQTLAESSCPVTKPVRTGERELTYRIGIISDLDERSKHLNKLFTWVSYMKRGKLILREFTGDDHENSVRIVWDDENIEFSSSLSQGGRGMELSELVCFDGKILSIDDRTGVIYHMIDRHASPWVILADGDGSEAKGFKGEWATVKDGELFVGGLGKEWTTKSGEVLNFNPQYIKIVSPSGAVTHVNWVKNYRKLLETAGIQPPGYMVHEAVVWSDVNRKWYFLPRRASKLKYDDHEDERRATNLLISCNEDFSKCNKAYVGPHNFTHGFSSFKFIPGTNEQKIIALKTEEVDGHISSYIMAFDLNGRILMREQKIPGNYKFEGIEFL